MKNNKHNAYTASNMNGVIAVLSAILPLRCGVVFFSEVVIMKTHKGIERIAKFIPNRNIENGELIEYTARQDLLARGFSSTWLSSESWRDLYILNMSGYKLSKKRAYSLRISYKATKRKMQIKILDIFVYK